MGHRQFSSCGASGAEARTGSVNSMAIMTDSEDTADEFATSRLGKDLANTKRYFRFSVPQGLQDLEMDECKAIERMNALTTEYLRKVGSGNEVQRCAESLLHPDANRG